MNKDNIRICTITHHTVLNYGAVLQAYALQKAIKKLGYNSEVLDYDSERVKRVYITSLKQVKTLKHFIKYVFFPYDKERKRNIQKFVDDNIIVSKKRYKKEELIDSNKIYDLFITGSDQVWNLRLHEGDTSYMLDFVTDMNKKGSYAASFGYNEVPEEYKELTKKNISDFKYLNIREKQGIDIIKNLIHREGNVVLDPTFLLEKDDYKDIEIPIKESKPYVLLYNLTKSKTIIEFAQKLAKENQCKLIVINTELKRVYNGKNVRDASPEKFISYIKNAKFVITSSFHGIAFSIIFNKPFYYELNRKKINNNSRLENISDIFGLESREISNVNDFKNLESINYKEVNAKLEALRKDSSKILKEMIEDCKKVK